MAEVGLGLDNDAAAGQAVDGGKDRRPEQVTCNDLRGATEKRGGERLHPLFLARGALGFLAFAFVLVLLLHFSSAACLGSESLKENK